MENEIRYKLLSRDTPRNKHRFRMWERRQRQNARRSDVFLKAEPMKNGKLRTIPVIFLDREMGTVRRAYR